jgi:hypothetical protein
MIKVILRIASSAEVLIVMKTVIFYLKPIVPLKRCFTLTIVDPHKNLSAVVKSGTSQGHWPLLAYSLPIENETRTWARPQVCALDVAKNVI